MKKIIKSVLIFSIVILGACSDDFLEKEALHELAENSFFQTEEHAVQSVTAIYNMFTEQDNIVSYLGMTDIVSDDTWKGSFPEDLLNLREFDEFTTTPSNGILRDAWRGCYRTIHRANLAIQRIPEVVDMDENLRTRLIAEAKFIRAFFYFRLVQWFGDVPLPTVPFETDFKIARSPVTDVYAQIEQDLMDAITVLPEKSEYSASDLGRATKGAARGILAKVYLTQQDWVNAEKYALEVINSGEYALLQDYRKIFRVESENASESVFEVQATVLETGDEGATDYNFVQGVRDVPNYGWGINLATDDLDDFGFEPGDGRKQATILYLGEVVPDGTAIVEGSLSIVDSLERYNQKAWNEQWVDGALQRGAQNIRLLRYADVLLMAAEAMNENGNATQALIHLNSVRDRARDLGNPFALPEVTTIDQSELREAIRRERRAELAMEQHRWFDLVRWGIAAETMHAVGKTNFVEGKHELFPIPQQDIDFSEGLISQNPGY